MSKDKFKVVIECMHCHHRIEDPVVENNIVRCPVCHKHAKTFKGETNEEHSGHRAAESIQGKMH